MHYFVLMRSATSYLSIDVASGMPVCTSCGVGGARDHRARTGHSFDWSEESPRSAVSESWSEPPSAGSRPRRFVPPHLHPTSNPAPKLNAHIHTPRHSGTIPRGVPRDPAYDSVLAEQRRLQREVQEVKEDEPVMGTTPVDGTN